MAERVGFEPTCPFGQDAFEAPPLRPLLYSLRSEPSSSLRARGRLRRLPSGARLPAPRQARRVSLTEVWVMSEGLKGWRRGWDSNPRALSDKTLSRRPRYDHFGTSPYSICRGAPPPRPAIASLRSRRWLAATGRNFSAMSPNPRCTVVWLRPPSGARLLHVAARGPRRPPAIADTR